MTRKVVLSDRWVVHFVLLIELISVIASVVGQTEADHGYDDDIYDERYDTFSSLGKDPTFDVPAANVSVKIGETAVLPCTVTYLGKYKVAWLDNSSIPLSLEDRRVIDDARVSVVRPTVREWNLQVQDVRRSDAGPYRCTVNTKRVIAKIVWLYVVEPATIKLSSSNDDATIGEGDDVTFGCEAEGNPQPRVTWHRQQQTTSGGITSGKKHACRVYGRQDDGDDSGTIWRGPILMLRNVSRHCEGTYECRAFNGILPVSTKSMKLTVLFRPEIRLANRRIGQTPGKQTILECSITASPNAVNFWQKNNTRVVSSGRYQIEAYEEREHTVTLSLRITNVSHEDYGLYRCVAENALGSDSKTMELFEYIEPETYKQQQTMGHPSAGPPPPSHHKTPKHDYYLSHNHPHRPVNSYERYNLQTSIPSPSSSLSSPSHWLSMATMLLISRTCCLTGRLVLFRQIGSSLS